jgi:flavin reductase (DIM6/NTAB) family NADH-FMN oxidoreductase RutF
MPERLVEAPSIGPVEFRSLMSRFPTGVAIITTIESDGRPWGMTCSSVCSVSVVPPVLLISLRQGSPTLAAMLRLSTFAVNLLHDRARPAAELFASGNANRFGRVRWRGAPAFGGPHLVDDAHTVADCQIVRTVAVGDHTVVFGEVFRVDMAAPEQSNPLLYGMRQYSSWTSGPPLGGHTLSVR